jgi:ketosteroid isomerase-like protein
MDDRPDPATPLLRAYADAVQARDREALLALYDPAVRVFDAWDRWAHDATGWRAAVADWFAALEHERMTVRFDDVRVRADAALASCDAFVEYVALAADGAPLRTMANRLTWVLARTDAGWRIVHEHSSAPVEFASLRAKTSRDAP